MCPVVVIKDDDAPRCDAPVRKVEQGVKEHAYTSEAIPGTTEVVYTGRVIAAPHADWMLLVPLLWRVLFR